MAPTINFEDVQGLDPVPAGTYNVEIVHAQEGVSKQGYPKIDVRYKIIGTEFDGRQVLDTMSFHRDALWRTKKTLQALGFPKTFNGEIGPGDLVGLSCAIVVTVEASDQVDEDGEPYEPRNRVTKVKKAGSGAADIFGE